MKVVILAGGLGSRLAEETEIKPKPMVEIGGRPILWHILKQYAHYGFKEFVIALGYKGESIKRYFLDYRSLSSNMTIDLARGKVEVHQNEAEDWLVHLIDTRQAGGKFIDVDQEIPGLLDRSFQIDFAIENHSQALASRFTRDLM